MICLVVSQDRSFPLVRAAAGAAGGGATAGAGAPFRTELSAELKKSDDSQVAVGDLVEVRVPAGHERAILERVLPRRTEIARVKRVGREGQVRRQVLAANVDVLFLVHSLTGGGLDMPLLIRQVCASCGAGCRPVLVLTKSDLVAGAGADSMTGSGAGAAAIAAAVAAAREIFPDLTCVSNKCLDDIAALIPTGTCGMLLGESGVGKSTLVNALCGLNQATAEVRTRDDKGRHTTVARRLLEVPGGGSIIDAPGLRTLQIHDLPAALAATFADIEALAGSCRFADCSHMHEPDCAVQAAVASGSLSAARLQAYLALREHL